MLLSAWVFLRVAQLFLNSTAPMSEARPRPASSAASGSPQSAPSPSPNLWRVDRTLHNHVDKKLMLTLFSPPWSQLPACFGQTQPFWNRL